MYYTTATTTTTTTTICVLYYYICEDISLAFPAFERRLEIQQKQRNSTIATATAITCVRIPVSVS
jgi:hypothetical protein